MRPLTVITGILLGSCASIFVSLTAILVIYLFLGDEYPRLNAEFDGLLGSLGVFTAMTAISALSFYSLVIGHKWRAVPQFLLWAGLIATGFYYWP